MKKRSTFHLKFMLFCISGILLAPQLLDAQTSHIVSVSSNVFSPDDLTINAGDTVIWINNQGSHNVNGSQETFTANPESFGNSVGSGWNYSHVFNLPGDYQYQCDPHANLGMTGLLTVLARVDANVLTVNFSNMTPHLGQQLYLVLKEKSVGNEIDRVSKTVESDFSIMMEGIITGESYEVEFFADHNENGRYDAPPTDHAWSLDLVNVTGDEILSFSHNTNFTDISWMHELNINFLGMTPHIGQKLSLFLRDSESGSYLDTIVIEGIPEADFTVSSFKVKPGSSYNVDFYSDHNKNGLYDAPPMDHAWRLESLFINGDTTLNFTHNTNFTNIFETTSTDPENSILSGLIYPVPAYSEIFVQFPGLNAEDINIYDITGKKVHAFNISSNDGIINIDIHELQPGIYILKATGLTGNTQLRFVKTK